MSAEDENVAAAAPAKSSKVLPLILVFNTLLLTGVLVFVMKRPAAQASAAAGGAAKEHGEEGAGAKGGEHGEKGAEGAAAGPGPTMRLDNFVVQVRATEGDRYAHITIEIEVGSEGSKKLFETRMPRIRDAIISHLSDKTEDELRGSEGLNQLKESLLKKMEELVPGHHARGIFITEFIIQ